MSASQFIHASPSQVTMHAQVRTHTHTCIKKLGKEQRGRGAVHAGHATQHSSRVKLLYLHPGARITAKPHRKQSHILRMALGKLVGLGPKFNSEMSIVTCSLSYTNSGKSALWTWRKRRCGWKDLILYYSNALYVLELLWVYLRDWRTILCAPVIL